ncbi:acyltransferase family protein [Aeromicrobium sp. JJY06]|uniref:acyltransferase family protein n=1 Tax=Aeromicrobium sp. JJY06 TaxID=3373478 RepID=UPI00376F3905
MSSVFSLRNSQGSRSATLDGVRGLAVVVLLLYHFGVSALQGAWVGISLFFVFSGYVIVMIMLKEHARRGRIDVVDFFRRRARRLLPALTIMLLAIATWGVLAADHATRRSMRGDILATMGFVMNWRLVQQADQYFVEWANPSFLRHVWTLAVEEQFYLVAPFLVMALIRLVHRRWARVAVVASLATASAVWTAMVGVGSTEAQAHAYYGTDTRVQALLAGMAVAFAVGPDRDGHRPADMRPRVAAFWAWAATLTSIACFFVVPPLSPFMFESGGMLMLAALTAVGLAGAVQVGPGLFRRVFTVAPLVYLGILTYGLYLWHWPVKLWLDRYAPALPVEGTLILGSLVTLALAALSFHLVEVPVMLGGLARLTGGIDRGRVLAVGATAAVVLAAVRVGDVPTVEEDLEAGRVPALVDGTPTYTPQDETVRTALYGDSVAHYLAQGFPDRTFSDLQVTDLATEGCSLLPLTIHWTPRNQEEVSDACREGRENLTENLRDADAEVLVLMVGSVLGVPHEREDGSLLEVDDPAYRATVEEQLDGLLADARAADVQQVQLATLPCRADSIGDYQIDAEDEDWFDERPEIAETVVDPRRINGWLTAWAEANGVPVLDLYDALECQRGFAKERHGIEVFRDQLHFSEEATPMVWTWLAPSIRERWQTRA